MTFELPKDHRPHTDAYFPRSRAILEAEGLDPWVGMQVFVRKGPGVVRGLEEATAMLARFSGLEAAGGRVLALPEGAPYAGGETVMRIEGPLVSFIEMETLYLGAITAATTLANGGREPDPEAVRRRAETIRELCPDKDLMYFGARHWHWSMDDDLAAATARGGFDSCSTDFGARAAGWGGGVGTIPHVLCLAMGHAHGRERGTREAALAFHRRIDPAVPRIALVDTFNRETDDSLDTARALGRDLDAVRLDTPGEVVGQGGDPDGPAHMGGTGVTTSLARHVRRALDDQGFGHVDIVLSSGFGDADKVRAFVDEERARGRLFSALGVGALFEARNATADVVRIEGREFAKAGREERPNDRLRRVL